MARVVLEGLSKVYPDGSGPGVRAVNRVGLEIESGEFMVLVGPSGCGKTTTLRMIAGLEAASEGAVSIDGRVVNDVPPKDRDIAMVFQNYALYPHMTVYRNMAFGLSMRRVPKAEIEARVNEAASMLGLSDCLSRKPAALSGGQRQRVAVGRAVVRKPKVFLFDEPLSNLDAQMRAATRVELARLHARLGATMIYVTHDQSEAMTLGDRICVMNGGSIQQVADPMEVYDCPANIFVAGFIGSPPMNFFKGGIAKYVCTGRSDVILGIRPEHIHPAQDGIPCEVVAVELFGSETHLHMKFAGRRFIARVRSDRRYRTGETVPVSFDMGKCCFFDSATQTRL